MNSLPNQQSIVDILWNHIDERNDGDVIRKNKLLIFIIVRHPIYFNCQSIVSNDTYYSNNK